MIQRILLPLLGGLGLIDILTTYVGVQAGYTEQNALLHLLQGNPLTLLLVMTLLKVVAIVGSAFLVRRSVILPALVLVGLFAIADLSNMLTLL
ncbi:MULTISPECIES: DUF5658 family protein [Metallosphaera]|uniref:Uncharacterized protein n=3 Tax=Metallosphaera TaxID=41980 RepID=A4YDK2_METS5|nr:MULTISPECIES: DUF5658 family protein [Metallosphaera]ABP94504.1 hypothetical protein Msed_0327 [Metallosphaera sedula DSM 5348]AIM26491.1 hypothetical protein HA72_0327 [Metallosphaera sedula]AKV73486.1 hypothetical protein MsedA_0340 [Metallosphaera sedula]AKV75728.1 hypothetical protein MsedB_0340 [Metallosphaera sedula]AKV77975.1 hypothetical protein MsedC_0339 [Metallosphaera sedula]